MVSKRSKVSPDKSRSWKAAEAEAGGLPSSWGVRGVLGVLGFWEVLFSLSGFWVLFWGVGGGVSVVLCFFSKKTKCQKLEALNKVDATTHRKMPKKKLSFFGKLPRHYMTSSNKAPTRRFKALMAQKASQKKNKNSRFAKVKSSKAGKNPPFKHNKNCLKASKESENSGKSVKTAETQEKPVRKPTRKSMKIRAAGLQKPRRFNPSRRLLSFLLFLWSFLSTDRRLQTAELGRRRPWLERRVW